MRNNIGKIWGRIRKDLKSCYLAILIFLLWNIVVRKLFHAFCPLLIITGFPCAGCGMTRAVLCILTGQFARAFALNPAAYLWLAWVIGLVIERYIIGRNAKWIVPALAVICVITLLIYGYRMLYQFPSYPPMTYYRNNLIAKYGTFWQELLQGGK